MGAVERGQNRGVSLSGDSCEMLALEPGPSLKLIINTICKTGATMNSNMFLPYYLKPDRGEPFNNI